MPSNLMTNLSRAEARLFTTKVTPMLLNAVAGGITTVLVAQEEYLTSGDSLGTKIS